MPWFKRLFEVVEGRGSKSYEEIQRSFQFSADRRIMTAPNGKIFQCGHFYTPSVQELRQEVANLLQQRRSDIPIRSCIFEHKIVGDALEIHAQYPNSIIQAASQFNCLEFPSPNVIPEDGIEAYEMDFTQGPACALACPAGTVFRNYFASVDGNIGQTEDRQINNLDDFERLLSNEQNEYFYVRNGYVFTKSSTNIAALNRRLSQSSISELDEFRKSIKIGVQQDTEVTFSRRNEIVSEDQGLISVTQAYCSALSCGYSGVSNEFWEQCACLVLEAAYEATILVAVKNVLMRELAENSRVVNDEDTCRDVFLTAVGGGVFANDLNWIGRAMGRAISIAETFGVHIRIHVCHFRSINRALQDSVDKNVLYFSQHR